MQQSLGDDKSDVRRLFQEAIALPAVEQRPPDRIDALELILLPPSAVPGALCEFNDEPSRALREHTERRIAADEQQPTRAHMLAVAHDLVVQSPWAPSLDRRRMIYNHLREMETRHFLLDDTLDEAALEQYERCKNYLLYVNIAAPGEQQPCRCAPFDFVPARSANTVIADWPSGRPDVSPKYATSSGRTYTICLPPNNDAAAWLASKQVDVLAYDPIDYFVNVGPQQRLLRYQLERQLDRHYAPNVPYPASPRERDTHAQQRNETVTRHLQALLGSASSAIALPVPKTSDGPQQTLLSWLQLTYASVPADERLIAEQARLWHSDLFCAIVDRRRLVARVLVLMLLERIESANADALVPMPSADRLVELHQARRFVELLSRTLDIVLAGAGAERVPATAHNLSRNERTMSLFVRRVYRDYLQTIDADDHWPPQPTHGRVFAFAEALRYDLMQRNETMALDLTYEQLVQRLLELQRSLPRHELYIDAFVLHRWALQLSWPAPLQQEPPQRKASAKALRHAQRRMGSTTDPDGDVRRTAYALRTLVLRRAPVDERDRWLSPLYDVYTAASSSPPLDRWTTLFDTVLMAHRPPGERSQWPAWVRKAWYMYDEPSASERWAPAHLEPVTRDQFFTDDDAAPAPPLAGGSVGSVHMPRADDAPSAAP